MRDVMAVRMHGWCDITDYNEMKGSMRAPAVTELFQQKMYATLY
jgi:hypothetical protein